MGSTWLVPAAATWSSKALAGTSPSGPPSSCAKLASPTTSITAGRISSRSRSSRRARRLSDSGSAGSTAGAGAGVRTCAWTSSSSTDAGSDRHQTIAGAYWVWALDATLNGATATNNWADYSRLGFDTQAIYISSNTFAMGGGFQFAKL